MQWLVEIGLSNAVAAVVLAVVAWGVGRLARRPAITHALCVLVLLKLLTPPIIELPLPLPIGEVAIPQEVGRHHVLVDARHQEATSSRMAAARPDTRPAVDEAAGRPPRRGKVSHAEWMPANPRSTVFAIPQDIAEPPRIGPAPAEPKGEATVTPQRAPAPPVAIAAAKPPNRQPLWAMLGTVLLGIWAAGIAVSFLVQGMLALRLRAVLRTSVPAPLEVRKAAARLAVQMGLDTSPPVRVVAAAGSPMLCGLGRRTCIVIPADLLARLSPDAQTTVLAHELAHFRRGDQWVRLVELIATGLYWWHPVVWWARQRIETAEEQCCDAHVLRECRGAARVYAEAILDIIDYLSEPAGQVRPVLSSGIRQRPLLQQRLRELMEGSCVPTVAPGPRRAIAIAGAMCLFYHPTFFVIPAERVQSTSMNTVEGRSDRHAWVRQPVVVQRPSPPNSGPSDGGGHTAEENPAPEVVARSVPRDVWATATSPNGRYQISVRPGYACELREVITGSVYNLVGHRIACVAFSPDSTYFVTGGQNGVVRLWDAASGVVLGILHRSDGAVRSIAWSPTGDLVAAAGADGVVRFLSFRSRITRLPSVPIGGPVRCVRFSADGRQLAIAVDTWQTSSGGRLAIYDVGSQSFTRRLQTLRPLGAVHYASHDHLLAADWSGQVVRLSVSRSITTDVGTVPKELVSAASFSADTRVLEAVAEETEAYFQSEYEQEGPI